MNWSQKGKRTSRKGCGNAKGGKSLKRKSLVKTTYAINRGNRNKLHLMIVLVDILQKYRTTRIYIKLLVNK